MAGTKALDSSDRIIYNNKTGDLSYDADGTGSTAAVKFAVMENKATITAADFLRHLTCVRSVRAGGPGQTGAALHCGIEA